jgi:protein transport protein SEC61 subunit alpha
MYGDVVDIGALNALLIIFQLVFAGVIVLCLDELLEKGYGLGSGISLFIATNICEIVMWKSFSINSYQTITGNYEYEGGIVALFHLLITKEDKVLALQRAFYRSDMGLPNITNLMSTVFIFLVVVWCVSPYVPTANRCNLFYSGARASSSTSSSSRPRCRHARRRRALSRNVCNLCAQGQSGQSAVKPIKLFYTSNMPVILLTAAVSNIYFFSQILYKRFPDNRIVGLFGSWSTTGMEAQSQLRPVGGLAYMVTAPTDMESALSDPLHALLYMSFMILSCGGLSYMWISVSGSSVKEEVQKMQAEGMSVAGSRATSGNQTDHYARKILNRYIPTAALLGGMAIGVLTIVADFMGAIGSGTGLLLAVTTIYEYYEIVKADTGGDVMKVLQK